MTEKKKETKDITNNFTYVPLTRQFASLHNLQGMSLKIIHTTNWSTTFHSHSIITDTAYNIIHNITKDLNFAPRNLRSGIILLNQTGNTKRNKQTLIRDWAIK
jgi:hypothetical protein